MPPTRKPPEVNTARVFLHALFLFFAILRSMVSDPARLPVHLPPGPSALLVLLARWFPPRVLVWAFILAGSLTLFVYLIDKLIIRHLVNFWFKSSIDPSWWLFHLSVGETTSASVPGRWKAGKRWRPGALVLTNRRIGFFPAAWGIEPWTLAREELARIETETPPLARLAAILNWPELLRISARTGEHARFALADPEVVLAWFTPDPRRDDVASPQRVAPQGAFDA